MGIENIRAELSAPFVGGRLGEISAKIGETLIKPEHNAVIQVLGAAMIDFADPKVSIFKIKNWRNI